LEALLRFWEFTQRWFPDFLQGAWLTIELTGVTFALGILLGALLAFMGMSNKRLVRGIAVWYIEIIRGTPLLVQLFFIYFALPEIGLKWDSFPAAVVAITLNEGAYIAEIIRAGIQSIDKGQMEAARSLGMSYAMAMWRVIIPQAARRALPPMVNELVALTKNTSLVSVIGLIELTRVGRTVQNATAITWSTWFWVSLFYLAMSLPLSRFAAKLEKKLGAGE
jgi:polar amino acid transport system permease protein